MSADVSFVQVVPVSAVTWGFLVFLTFRGALALKVTAYAYVDLVKQAGALEFPGCLELDALKSEADL